MLPDYHWARGMQTSISNPSFFGQSNWWQSNNICELMANSSLSTVAERNKLEFLPCFLAKLGFFYSHDSDFSFKISLNTLLSPFAMFRLQTRLSELWQWRMVVWTAQGRFLMTVSSLYPAYTWLHGRPHWLSLPTESWGWPYLLFPTHILHYYSSQ